MPYKTLDELVQMVIIEIGLVPGTNVQTYGEPIIEQALRNSYQVLFDKVFWDHLTISTTHELDGLTGMVVDELTDIATAADIMWIRAYPYGETDRIEQLNDGDTEDTTRIRWESVPFSDANYSKRVRLYPTSTAGNIRIRARRFISISGTQSVVPLDDIMLMHLTVAHILAADGLFPAAETRHQSLFEDRYQTLIQNQKTGISRFNLGHRSMETFTVAEE